jgi:DNA polymerase-3 subunit alpha
VALAYVQEASMILVPMHHHSTFSFGDGYGTPFQHVERAVELGYSAITLTEHGNVSSHFQLEKAAIKLGIKPIFGLEAYTGPVDLETRSRYKWHLTILAESNDGYRSLNRIVTQSYLDFYDKPTVSGISLQANRRGIVVLSGCSGSMLACSLLGGKGTPEHHDKPDFDAAAIVAERFDQIFPDRYFLEVQPFPELERTRLLNFNYELLSKELGIPLVVGCDVHYPRPEDAEMQAILHASHRGNHTVDDMMRSWNYDVLLTLPSTDGEIAGKLVETGLSKRAAWDAIENSAYIGGLCNVTLPKAERLKYPIGEDDLRPWA